MAIVLLVVLVAIAVIGGGGCLVCMGIAAHVAEGKDAAAPTGPTAENGESTMGRTPVALQLETALRKDGVPLDHVECPLAPPSPNSFACAVLPPNEGDPAEVMVTNGPNGMGYKLQEGFVILDGAKLASTFAGIAARTSTPQMNVPCFKDKILKHADTNFTCEVQNKGAVVGYVTTNVVGGTGDVKMDYKPNAKTNAGAGSAPAGTGASGSIDGTYACMVSTYQRSPSGYISLQFVPSSLPRFTISGGSYTASGKAGMIRISGQVVMFIDGAYDGWQGLLGTNSTGRYILLRGSSHNNAQPGVATKIGDSQCYIQK